ncbi:sodium/glutamate symporter [Sporosarcina pasteurii]|uniref:Sodium/glutamate symporter n=1 Tax=Sporosarcina pasteurii TaxID=1474 RepID=A0A380BBW6_SPOPA|nr:sodium/glutamate symporter [Sporosarcina pasteurii]MDS9472384.1 sodium/glutamate symporter [Sporosarcina pasteurii]QBQ06361.1 sodium:glutamate symporter [Sporosarcina pasteurii]SUI98896.1 Sodium/glutamate symporter [Sporosarcina pasteurii]
MDFSPWVLFTDIGLISLLLLVGTIIRAKVKFVQKMFLPASIIAGILALTFGPNGFGLLPFSDQMKTYPGILIAVIFGTLPLLSPRIDWKAIKTRVGSMWAYSQLAMVLMWGGGLLFAMLFLNPFWDGLHDGFGLLLAAGFVGGHGTAAAIGATFAQNGWEEATSLAMTSATVGIISAILIGILFIKRGSTKGQTSFLASFSDLPNELRTGLIPPGSRVKSETDTVSSISIDPYVFHFAIVTIIAMGGYYLSQLGAMLIPSVVIPAFSLAFLVGLLVKKILNSTNTEKYVSTAVVDRISGSATDILVAFGIGSISISVVLDYAVPLLILFVFGLLFAYLFFSILSKRFFEQYWFEKGIFTWGWTTGTVAMGMALLRIVDPDSESKTLDDYGLAYIPIAPVEILLVTFAPLFVLNSQSWIFVSLVFGFSLLIYGMAIKYKWLNRTSATK